MVVWYYDVDGLDGGRHMDLARTEEADFDPPKCPGTAEVRKCTRDSRSASWRERGAAKGAGRARQIR